MSLITLVTNWSATVGLGSFTLRAPYNRAMSPQRLADDTTTEVERLQVAAWRAMSPPQKAAAVSGLTAAAFTMARAGIRHRFPDATPREQFLRLAMLTLGSDLAVRVYPDAATLIE